MILYYYKFTKRELENQAKFLFSRKYKGGWKDLRYWLRELREKAGYNQTEFAQLVKLSKSYISEIEKGNRTPSFKVAYRIATTLKFDMERFYEAKKITFK